MLLNKIDKQEITAADALIESAHSVAIVTHLSPDGDAMGSALAMQHYVEALGKDLVAVLTPNRCPDFLMWLPGAENVVAFTEHPDECRTILQEADLIIGCDFNELHRIGEMGEIVRTAQAQKLLLDHHPNPEFFAQVTISYPSCSSTSELVFRLICRCGDFPLIDTPTATCIYTGMMTDTGNFSFNSNQPDIYGIISELVSKGIDKDAIYDHVFNTYSVDRMRLMGFCLYQKMQIYPEQHCALIALSKEELSRFHFQSGDAEGLVNLPLQIGSIYYSVFMREDVDKIKLSFRSQGDRPVNAFAREYFHGGGHLNAAGGEFYGTVEEAVALFEAHFKDYWS